MTQLLGILGYPLRHSISPVFQQAALDFCGIDARYEAWETHPDALAERVRWIRETPQALGANVTVPHKEKIIPLLDEVNPFARRLGAVNTIVKRDGRLVGHNTDGPGFLRALKEEGQFSVAGKDVLVLGAGGSARAVVLTLAQEGASSIAIANRTVPRAQLLATELAPGKARAVALEPEALGKAGQQWRLIVNCTSVGMLHGPAEGQSPIPAELIPPEALVYDLVYNPPETPLLRLAKERGARTLGGLAMLIYQGAEAFTLWTGRDAPVDVMFKAGERALSPASKGTP